MPRNSLNTTAQSAIREYEPLPQARMMIIQPDEFEDLKRAANEFCESGQVRNFRGDRYTVQDDVSARVYL
jgi:hypothetical protein